MRLLKEALGVLGALVVIAVIVAFVAPKRTHALVAALVQIVPGTTTQVGQNESQLVSLFCNSNSTSCVQIDRLGEQSSTAYVVPTGYTLIVTDYEWSGSSTLLQAGTLVDDALYNANDLKTFNHSRVITDKNGSFYAHEHYSTGIRIGSGVVIADGDAFGANAYAYVQGYLVPND